VVAGRRRVPPPTLAPPPGEWATAELGRLAASEPDADALAAILRSFLTRQFHIQASTKTTSDVVALLGATGVKAVRPAEHEQDARATQLGPIIHAWQALLEWCDVVRFANLGVSVEQWTEVLTRARGVIAESLPVVEAAASTADDPVGEKA
jgi:hypothetical protein